MSQLNFEAESFGEYAFSDEASEELETRDHRRGRGGPAPQVRTSGLSGGRIDRRTGFRGAPGTRPFIARPGGFRPGRRRFGTGRFSPGRFGAGRSRPGRIGAGPFGAGRSRLGRFGPGRFGGSRFGGFGGGFGSNRFGRFGGFGGGFIPNRFGPNRFGRFGFLGRPGFAGGFGPGRFGFGGFGSGRFGGAGRFGFLRGFPGRPGFPGGFGPGRFGRFGRRRWPWLNASAFGLPDTGTGGSSDMVSWAQSCLAQLTGESIPQDGVMGQATRRAIQVFQSQQQLAPTGSLDENTVNALQDACSAGDSGSEGNGGEEPPQ